MASFSDAVKRIEAIQARDTAEINPICRTRFLSHGRRVERAIIFLHGYTNSPAQFAPLGARFYDLGYNVLIPRLPHHGYADRLTPAHARLDANELRAETNAALDIARGLGNHITIAGISLGGVLAAFAAQQRADVDLAVLIASAFSTARFPFGANTALAHTLLKLPNRFIWWNSEQKAHLEPAHAYPRFSTHALARGYLIGAEVYQRARKEKPAARAILSITTAPDPAVNNRATAQLIARWRARGTVVNAYEFRGEQIPSLHDIIDPAQPAARIDLFYPKLIELICGAGS
ncbi:MAG: alpha/beta fold hydrolase [Chloroflexi bacterium]|nr:alpha/beta fold hydrolase [Chloroflexota bacterium]